MCVICQLCQSVTTHRPTLTTTSDSSGIKRTTWAIATSMPSGEAFRIRFWLWPSTSVWARRDSRGVASTGRPGTMRESCCGNLNIVSSKFYFKIFLYILNKRASLASWLMMNLLLIAVPRYGAYTKVVTGLLLVLTTVGYYLMLPKRPLTIYIEGGRLEFRLGWCYWLVLVAGVLCLFTGLVISVIDLVWPHTFSTILEVKPQHYFKENRFNLLWISSDRSTTTHRTIDTWFSKSRTTSDIVSEIAKRWRNLPDWDHESCGGSPRKRKRPACRHRPATAVQRLDHLALTIGAHPRLQCPIHRGDIRSGGHRWPIRPGFSEQCPKTQPTRALPRRPWVCRPCIRWHFQGWFRN